MTKRVSPIDRVRADIDQLFASERPLTEILEDVGRLGVRLVFQTAVEAEVEAFLDRGRYQRRDEDSPAGSRNGYQPAFTVKSTMGPVELQRPKLRDTDERFCSRLFGDGVTRTNALEALVISGWVRGLSDRDIEAALGEALGAEAALSRSTVSRIRLPGHPRRVRRLELAAPRRRHLGLSVLGRLELQDAPERPGRAGARGRGALTPTASPSSSGSPLRALSPPTPGSAS